MKIMIAGDTHGHDFILRRKAEIARDLNINLIFVVGDFGLWPGPEGVKFLDAVQRAAEDFSVSIVALPGNHEDHDQWEKWLDFAPKSKRGNFSMVRSRVALTPKVHPFKIGGKRFYVCGGAVSIDRAWRKPGKSWWPNETFSPEDLASVQKYKGPPVDYLLTHDAPDYTPWGFNLVPDPLSKNNRERIDEAIKVLRPGMHFHGHMHRKYEWDNYESHGSHSTAWGVDESEWNGHITKTYGLECDGEDYSWGVLDTKTDEFMWSLDARRRILES